MRSALNVFDALMKQTKVSDGLYQYFKTQAVPLDLSDLLRWQWVLAVSSLDKYVHDVVRIGMVEEFKGIRPPTPKFQDFKINMKKYDAINCSSSPDVEFENEIMRQHSFLAFQLPDKISDALSFIWDEKNKWDIIVQNMTTIISPNDAKTKLKNIVTRRNQIVHEGDCLTTIFPLEQQPVRFEDVQDVLNFVKEIAGAIYKCLT
jgi:hypothetical protein